jgi:RNA polymerase sigma-70 factor (ECF subfamily)
MTDEQLLAEYAKSGSQDAFGELFERLREKITATLVGFGLRFESAKDVIQEAFLKVHLHCAEFRYECSVCTWITAIALNLARSNARKLSALRVKQHSDAWFFLTITDYRRSHEDEIAQKQEHDNLNRMLETELGHKHAEVVRLLDIDGMDYEDAANELHIPVGTVRSRRHRAVIRLRQLMAAVVLLAVGVCSVFSDSFTTG